MIRVSPSIVRLVLTKPVALTFAAGQAVKVAVGGARRSYTIASAPGDAQLELCVELVPGGALSPKLHALAPGARVDVAPRAKGSLVFDARATSHVMFSTVTGIAPFRSMLRDVMPGAPQTRVVLVHGARDEVDLVYRDEMEALAGARGLPIRTEEFFT